MMKVMVTCPPMLGMIDEFRGIFRDAGVELVTPNVVQTLSEEKLKKLLPQMDGWIIGDDPATRQVFEAGKAGNLKAAVKWGVGTDNVDFKACEDLGIPIINTPNMFGTEVADIAINYVIGLARQTFFIDREVRKNKWPKPCGISLADRKVGLIGFGDIGKACAKRLRALDMKVTVYDPYADQSGPGAASVLFAKWPDYIGYLDFIVITCALNKQTQHMINESTINEMKDGVRIVNVSRGPIIDENALIAALNSGKVHSAGLDVFEIEPLSPDSPLRAFPQCIFGTHNGSNTIDGVRRATYQAIRKLFEFLEIEAEV